MIFEISVLLDDLVIHFVVQKAHEMAFVEMILFTRTKFFCSCHSHGGYLVALQHCNHSCKFISSSIIVVVRKCFLFFRNCNCEAYLDFYLKFVCMTARFLPHSESDLLYFLVL